jgi:hypothetical protein
MGIKQRQNSCRTHQAQYNNHAKIDGFLAFPAIPFPWALQSIYPVGDKAYTREVVGLQLQSFLLLPKTDGIFQQNRYALFKRRFGSPSAILSGDGIDEETRKVADILWLRYCVVRSKEQIAFARFLSLRFS